MGHTNGLLVPVMILWAGIVWAGNTLDCVYRPKGTKTNRQTSTGEYRNCATNVRGRVVLSREHLRRIAYDRYGLGTVFVEGRHYYVKANGSMLPVVALDNWADDYSEGLVRSAVNGRIAFYTRGFKQAIAPKYEWASPFKNGRSLVCIGCKTENPDEEGHRAIKGGKWGYINSKGRETVPVRYSREEAEGM